MLGLWRRQRTQSLRLHLSLIWRRGACGWSSPRRSARPCGVGSGAGGRFRGRPLLRRSQLFVIWTSRVSLWCVYDRLMDAEEFLARPTGPPGCSGRPGCAWAHRYRSRVCGGVGAPGLRLVTPLGPEELAAAEVALLYKQRWRMSCSSAGSVHSGCRHWLAESPQGVAIEVYLALIAALLLQLYTGQAPNRRMMELIQFYLLGVASLDELEQGLERERQQVARRKKS